MEQSSSLRQLRHILCAIVAARWYSRISSITKERIDNPDLDVDENCILVLKNVDRTVQPRQLNKRGDLIFLGAKPIWPKGMELERNLTIGFRAAVECPANKTIVLRVAASTVYRCFVNGTFCGYGPARAGHGYYRIDEWDLGATYRTGKEPCGDRSRWL